MNNWRKVFTTEFKDEFKPFTTKNKVKLPNRAKFTGDELVTKTGDPAKVELSAWHREQNEFNSYRNKERKDDYTSLVSVPEGREEHVRDVVANNHKWFRKFSDVFNEQVPSGEESTEDAPINQVPTNIVEEGVRSFVRNWREILSYGEPDINLKRKPDGTMELNVTHPTPEAEDQEQNQLQQEDQQFNQPQPSQIQKAPEIKPKTQLNQAQAQPQQTASMRKKAYGEDLLSPYLQKTYVTEDDKYEVYFADNYIELIQNNRIVNQFDYPQNGQSAPVHGEPKESGEEEGVYLNDMDQYLEFYKNGRVITTLRFKDMKEAPEENLDNFSSLKKKASKDDVHEWIIKKEGSYTLLGRECKDSAGIFLLKLPVGVMAKVAALDNKLHYAIDKEVISKNGHSWRELINEAVWLEKFNSIIKGEK